MAYAPRRGKIKPWGEKLRWPGPEYVPSSPLPDPQLEQFALLMARNAPMRRAVLTAFPNASATATNYRAHRLMNNPGVRARVQWLQRQIGLPDVGESRPSAQGIIPPAYPTSDPAESVGAVEKCSSDQTFLEESNNRRHSGPSDLTPAELRLIISEGARAGNSAAINAAIKMLDASLSAPPAQVDPAAVCAVLFNGGGGGESLRSILLRLSDVFGAQAVMDCAQSLFTQQNPHYATLDAQVDAGQVVMEQDRSV